MASMKCPNCGGPAQLQPGQTTVPCSFCGTTFSVAAPTPAPAPTPWAQPPPVVPPYGRPYQPIIVVPPGESFGTSTAAAGTFLGMRLLFGIIPAVVALLIAGVTIFTTNRAVTGAGMSGFGLGAWNGTSPLVCGGNDSVEATGISASFASGSVINAGGNCHVTCRGCTLKAPVVVAAGGNAEVDLVDCHIVGSPQAVVAGGNASIRITGSSTVSGEIVQGGNASIVAPPSASASPGKTPAASPSPTPTIRSGPSPAAPSHGPSKPH